MAMKVACGNGFPLNIPSEIPTGGGGGGTGDYSDLTNKPQINDVTLSGNKSLSDIGAAAATDVSDIQDLIPSDASSSNKLATSDDLPGLATTSAPGLVQPDGTTITIADGVISAFGGGVGNVKYTSFSIDLSTLTWSGSTGSYYTPGIQAITNGQIVGIMKKTGWANVISQYQDLIFFERAYTDKDSNLIGFISNKNTFDANTTVSWIITYI